MGNLEQLKNELLSQKTAIEAKGGSVQIANNNPSPAEITAGITSIPLTDFSMVTATANDVATGKVFYDSDGELTTGSSVAITPEMFNKVVLYGKSSDGSTTYYTLPENTTYTRPYLFYAYPNTLHLTLNEELTEIGAGLLDSASNAYVTNLDEMDNLITIGDSAFMGCHGIDFENLPTNLEVIGSKTFQNAIPENATIRFGSKVRQIGTYCFASSSKLNVTDVIITDATDLATISGYSFQNLLVANDFIPSSGVKTLSASCAYGSDWHNIYIGASVTSIGTNAFNCSSADVASQHICFSVEFLGNTPPTIGVNFLTTKVLRTGFHIYVPDNAFDNYYTISNLSNFKSYIARASER